MTISGASKYNRAEHLSHMMLCAIKFLSAWSSFSMQHCPYASIFHFSRPSQTIITPSSLHSVMWCYSVIAPSSNWIDAHEISSKEIARRHRACDTDWRHTYILHIYERHTFFRRKLKKTHTKRQMHHPAIAVGLVCVCVCVCVCVWQWKGRCITQP